MAFHKALLIFLVVFLALFVGYTAVWRPESAEVEETDPTYRRLAPSDLELVPEKCEVGDQLEYRFYEDRVSLGKIQDNIGYVNNKFGLYIYSTKNFIRKADELVNSQGGDWGYVLIPYNVKDYDRSKWQEIFNYLAVKHLIPIIQLWDVDLNSYEKQTKKAAAFLNQFAWPIQKKYISAYNEVNDERFWKGKLDPEGYAEVLDFTIKTFKNEDKNFFIMNGAFNATAPNGNGYMDEVIYLMRMNQKVEGIFLKLDGWASHPYPQPAYLGLPNQTGRASIKAYEWELAILNENFGVKNLPVFITETGWPHAEGESPNPLYYSADKTAQFYKQAFEEVWLKDERVVAVTPFTIYYDPPHDHFSWVKKDGSVYPQFEVIKSMPKAAGRPPVLNSMVRDILKCP